jgi:hypothetical protein
MTNRKRAERFVDDLMTNGAGEKAHRLVLTRDMDNRISYDLGGWGRRPLVDKITALLDACQSDEPAQSADAVARSVDDQREPTPRV